MTSSSTQVLSIKRKVLAAVATLTIVAGVSAAATGAASAATQSAWAPDAASRFSAVNSAPTSSPTSSRPSSVGEERTSASRSGLKRANGTTRRRTSSRSGARCPTSTRMGWCPPRRTVTTAAWTAVQQKYAPFGIETALCVGLARSRTRTRGSPCSRATPTTVWIIYPPRRTPSGYFPIVNATTTDFNRPFAMHLPRNEVASGKPLQMHARRLQFLTGEKTLPARQLWGAWSGELN